MHSNKKSILKLKVLITLLFSCHFCFGQQQQYCINFPSFKAYVNNILVDSTNHWSEYPKPPKVADDVLLGMENEIITDDSARYFLNHLCFKNYKWAIDYDNAFNYFNKKDYTYTILALTAHWNPDLRVSALTQLNKKFRIRPFINSAKAKNGEWKKYDPIAIQFLINLLQSNPLLINGSENATIHGYYISNILWNLDLLTGENIVGENNLREWYKNDLQLSAAVLKWKNHIK